MTTLRKEMLDAISAAAKAGDMWEARSALSRAIGATPEYEGDDPVAKAQILALRLLVHHLGVLQEAHIGAGLTLRSRIRELCPTELADQILEPGR